MVKGSEWCQPSAFLVATTSSGPKGAPCASPVPALLGEPCPIVVVQIIKVGLFVSFLASLSALSISSKFVPSTGPSTCQPYELNLEATSSLNVTETSPSIEIPLLSYKYINFPKL